MQRITRLVAAGWIIESWQHGGRYAVMVRAGAKRIVADQYWNTVWISGLQ